MIMSSSFDVDRESGGGKPHRQILMETGKKAIQRDA